MKPSTRPTMKTQHTALPWEIGHQLGDGFSIVHEIAPNCGKLVCLATAHNIGLQLNDETAKANQDFIILAVNSHDALVAALKNAEEQLADVLFKAKRYRMAIEASNQASAALAQVRKALAKAEGRAS